MAKQATAMRVFVASPGDVGARSVQAHERPSRRQYVSPHFEFGMLPETPGHDCHLSLRSGGVESLCVPPTARINNGAWRVMLELPAGRAHDPAIAR